MSTIPSGSTIIWAAPTATDNFNWINAISGWLTSLGVAINTGVSGQINLGTGSVALPGTITTNTTYSMGYEVRQLVSPGLPTLQVRIDYQLIAAGTTAATLWPIIVVTVGTTVNTTTGVLGGSVTSAGATSLNTVAQLAATAPTGARPIFMSSDGANFLTISVDPGRSLASPTTVLAAIALERTLTASNGAYNNGGYQLLSVTSITQASASNGSGIWNVNLSTGVCNYSGSFGVAFPSSMYTSSGGGTSPIISPVGVMIPQPQGPMLAAIGYFHTDVSPGIQFTVLIYGSNHNYLATGLAYISFSQFPATAGSTTGFGAQRLAVRYE